MRSLLLKLHLHPSPLWVIFEINFFRNFASAMLTAVLPIYFRQFVNSDGQVGFIFFAGYLAAFFAHLYSSHIIEHFKKRKSLLIALLGFTALFASFAFIKNTALVFGFFALYQFILSLFVLDVSLYIKHYSDYRNIAENEGKLGSLGNIGWLVGPFLGALIATTFGFETVFLVSSAISFIALFTFFFIRLKGETVQFHHKQEFFKNIKQFFRDPQLRKTYINNAGLGFIYSIWDYLPLLMLNFGATLPVIGLTKTLMGVPQSIFEFPIGRMADRETGERRIFIVGYALAALGTLFLGLTADIQIFLIVFFIAATGTSFLEMTRDAYFFRQMPEKEVELVSVYRTSDTLPFLVGQGLAITGLSLFPIEWWFIVGGGLAFAVFVINAWKLKEIRNSKS